MFGSANSDMNEATWRNTKTGKRVKGRWRFNWASDSFTIVLSRDKTTGSPRVIVSTDDEPIWGDWKLVKPRKKVKP